MLKKAEKSSVFTQSWHGCLCVRFRCACVRFRCACVRFRCACVRFRCACVRFRCACVRFRCACVRFRCACVCFRCVCGKLLTQQLFRQQSRAFYMLALCLRAVLISSPDTRVWTRMHALAVMHRRTLCENVDSAKIKVPFYTTDIDILRVASMHRIVIHCIDISDPYRWIVTTLVETHMFMTGIPGPPREFGGGLIPPP